MSSLLPECLQIGGGEGVVGESELDLAEEKLYLCLADGLLDEEVFVIGENTLGLAVRQVQQFGSTG